MKAVVEDRIEAMGLREIASAGKPDGISIVSGLDRIMVDLFLLLIHKFRILEYDRISVIVCRRYYEGFHAISKIESDGLGLIAINFNNTPPPSILTTTTFHCVFDALQQATWRRQQQHRGGGFYDPVKAVGQGKDYKRSGGV
ncbi:hypothetical protein L2E82_05481 [Cichorium intybus]|uniref:Uncharacterized protein n=1 Tax=Cichorium intybus TaxID=13427 RepID=A0ACB9H9J7_CICIN|nr:hypothetical protein L2E82_05481 [Cichorium intybus]